MIISLNSNHLDALENVYFNSFPADEAPITFKLISEIIEAGSTTDSLVLGYEVNGALVAGVAFSPVVMKDVSSPGAFILAPLAVHSEYHHKGIARQLIESGKETLAARGIDFLFVYGDPAFYGRFGFSVELGKCFVPPYELEYDFGWQALQLGTADAGHTKHSFTCIPPLSDASLW